MVQEWTKTEKKLNYNKINSPTSRSTCKQTDKIDIQHGTSSKIDKETKQIHKKLKRQTRNTKYNCYTHKESKYKQTDI